MKAAIVLSGGGAKGAYQVGVLSELIKQGLEPSVFYGTSVGSLNSFGMAYLGIAELEKLWLSIKGRSDILAKEYLKLFWADALYNLKPLRKTLETHIHDKPFYEANACRIQLESGATEFVNNLTNSKAKFIEAVLGSCAIPMIMAPVNGYVDGGVRQHTPLAKAIADGHKNIIVILTSPISQNTIHSWQYPKNRFLRFYKILKRSIDDIMTHEIMWNDIHSHANSDVNIKIYAPSKIYMDTIEFNPYKIKEAINGGKLDACLYTD